MSRDYYDILGIRRGASSGEIRDAYRKQVKKHHPDACGPGADAEEFIALEKAYETLRDAERRRRYDEELSGAPERTPFVRDDLEAELVLSPAEARRGGIFTLTLPDRCFSENPLHMFFGFMVWGARGMPVSFRLPPHVEHGTLLRLDLAAAGFPDRMLRLRILVE